MGASLIAIAGLLAAVLATANEDLDGARYVAYVAIGAFGGALLVEATNRRRRARVALGAAALAICVGAVALALDYTAPTVNSAEDDAVASDVTDRGRNAPVWDPLRARITGKAPDVFYVAFGEDPGLPGEQSGWSELIESGGIDVRTSLFDLTLANRSDEPLTITDIHAEVISSRRSPSAALAYVYTQGDGPLGQFAVRLKSDAPGVEAKLYDVVDGIPGWLREPPRRPYFDERYIALQPGEIYEGTVAVEADPERLIDYRFVIEGSTPTREFEHSDPDVRRISGLDDYDHSDYDRYYVDGFLDALSYQACPDLERARWYAEPPGGAKWECP